MKRNRPKSNRYERDLREFRPRRKEKRRGKSDWKKELENQYSYVR